MVWTIQSGQANSIQGAFSFSNEMELNINLYFNRIKESRYVNQRYQTGAGYPMTFFPNQLAFYNRPTAQQTVQIPILNGYGAGRQYVQPIVYQYQSIGSSFNYNSNTINSAVPSLEDVTERRETLESESLIETEGSGDEKSISQTVADDVVESTTEQTTQDVVRLLEDDGLIANLVQPVEQTTDAATAVANPIQPADDVMTTSTLSPGQPADDAEKSVELPTTPAVPAVLYLSSPLPFYLRPVDYRRTDPARYLLPSPYGHFQLHGPVTGYQPRPSYSRSYSTFLI